MNFKRNSSSNIAKNNEISDDDSNQNSYSSDEAFSSSTVSQCLKYAQEVANLFSDGLKYEKKKWKRTGKADEICNEKVVWMHAKRISKMIAIQSKNLDHLVELMCDNVSKECPNHDSKELKDLAKYDTNSSHDYESFKGNVNNNLNPNRLGVWDY